MRWCLHLMLESVSLWTLYILFTTQLVFIWLINGNPVCSNSNIRRWNWKRWMLYILVRSFYHRIFQTSKIQTVLEMRYSREKNATTQFHHSFDIAHYFRCFQLKCAYLYVKNSSWTIVIMWIFIKSLPNDLDFFHTNLWSQAKWQSISSAVSCNFQLYLCFNWMNKKTSKFMIYSI